MDDLLTRLRAKLDEVERIARAATVGPWRVDDETYAEVIYGDDDTSVVAGGRWGGEASVFDSTADALHIAAQNPAVTLRMVAAHRKILDEHERICAEYNDPARTEPMAFGPAYGLWIALVALAEGYGIEA